jgi:hypothetical protein
MVTPPLVASFVVAALAVIVRTLETSIPIINLCIVFICLSPCSFCCG